MGICLTAILHTTPHLQADMPRFRVFIADFIADELRIEREILSDIADLDPAANADFEADLALARSKTPPR